MHHHDGQAAAEENSSKETSSVGQELKAAREALELPIKQLAGDLRIEPHYLAALEEDNFDAFSAPVFAMGYLKQYAIRLGLDEKKLLAGYFSQVGTQELPTLRTPSLQSGADQQQTRLLVWVSAIVFVVAAILIWWFSTNESEAPVVRQPTANIPMDEPDEPMDEPDEPVIEPAGSGDAFVARPAPVERVEVPAAAPVEVVKRTLQVEIRFHEDCWTEVIDGRGERLFYDLGSVGARTRFSATPPLSFLLGNVDGVELLVDEMPYSIPAGSRQGNLARFVILESGG
jgi:cytoskeleton protein RodZ